MSATNHTSTIELSQYISTDKPTYLTDYNGDMLKIDNAIAADRDAIATAQGTANTADGKADINKTNIDALNVQLNGDPEDPSDVGVAGDVNALEGTVNTVTALLGNGSPTTSDQTVIGAINGLEGAIAPREDGATLANSYSIGDQFARGGSVYEALASLTAGTAFASLVLNTDYKVADTLVEQIANAGVTLPNGYYVKKVNDVVIVAPDGVKTTRELLTELAGKLLAKAQALGDNELLIPTYANFQGGATVTDSYAFGNTATRVYYKFGLLNYDGSTSTLSVGEVNIDTSTASPTSNAMYRAKLVNQTTVSVADESTLVPTGGSYSVYFNVLAKF